MAIDSATEMEEKVDPPQQSKTKWKINKNLVMLKLTLFFLYGGKKNIIFARLIYEKNFFF